MAGGKRNRDRQLLFLCSKVSAFPETALRSPWLQSRHGPCAAGLDAVEATTSRNLTSSFEDASEMSNSSEVRQQIKLSLSLTHIPLNYRLLNPFMFSFMKFSILSHSGNAISFQDNLNIKFSYAFCYSIQFCPQ